MTTPTDQQPAPGAPPAPEPTTFDADYVKKLREEAAKYRTEAKTNADAAAKLAKLEEDQKSETQKLADAATAAKAEAEAAKADALRWRVAAKHGISDDDAELFLTGTDEATLTKQAERLTERVVAKTKNGNRAPTEGRTPPAPGTDPVRELARGLFGAAADS